MEQGNRLPNLSPGTIVGNRYRIDAYLGGGGMGRVYQARDDTLNRNVAIKIFHPTVDAADDDLRRRFSEIQILASMDHPCLVTLFDAHLDMPNQGEMAYLVMELVDGPTLRDRLTRGPLKPEDVAWIAVDLGQALSVVHARGVVHRDVKPSNILLRESQEFGREFTAKLADFGVAHLLGSPRMTIPGTPLGKM
jgi:serine/threonine protein kinase